MTASARPRLLDGAMGTELMRRGYEMHAPRWGAGAVADAPQCVQEIHRAYVSAGADVLRANTFGLGAADAELCANAVELARRAAVLGTLPCAIAGAIGPANPNSPEANRRTHYRVLAEALRDAGADVLMAETQTSIRGAREASEALAGHGLPVWIALSCGADGRTLHGEPLADAELDVDVLLVGCTEADALRTATAALRAANPTTPLGVVPSTACTRDGAFDPNGASESAVAAAVDAELAAGPLAVVGGCCGTSPAFTALLRAHLGALCPP